MDPNLDVSLEGFLDHNAGWYLVVSFSWRLIGRRHLTRTANIYNSAEFQQMANQSAAFLDLLPPYLDGRPVSLRPLRDCRVYHSVVGLELTHLGFDDRIIWVFDPVMLS